MGPTLFNIRLNSVSFKERKFRLEKARKFYLEKPNNFALNGQERDLKRKLYLKIVKSKLVKLPRCLLLKSVKIVYLLN